MNPNSPAAATIGQRLADRAAATPEGTAFRCRDSQGPWQAVDWASVAHQVGRLRRGLAAAGLVRGDRLALIAPVSLDWELIHHAALSMGVAVVGLDAHDLPSRVAAMAEQAGVAALAVIDPGILAQLSPVLRARIRLLVCMGAAPVPDGSTLGIPTHRLGSLSALGDQAVEPEPARSDDIATIIFTSGTTGAPKGIAYSHAQLCLAIGAIAEAFSFVGQQGRLLCWLPLSNLFQRMVNLAALSNGATTYLLADPRQVMTAVGEVEPDIFIGVPRFFEKLHAGIIERLQALPFAQRQVAWWAWRIGHVAGRYRQAGRPVPAAWRVLHGWVDKLVLGKIRSVMGSRLRCMVSGSAPMSLAVLQDFDALGWPLLEAYGLSENVLPMAMNRIDSARLGTVGRPLAGNQIVIGGDGVIAVRGAGVFTGYLDEAPWDTPAGQGYYATGDLGTLDAAGYLTLTGRTGDIIKTSTGRRVAPVGVEAMLRGAPGVDQAVLLGAGRKYLLALCTVDPKALQGDALAALESGLRAALALLNPMERPAGIALLATPFSIEAGELTPNLKLRRAAIERQRAAALAALTSAIEAPSQNAGQLTILVCRGGDSGAIPAQ